MDQVVAVVIADCLVRPSFDENASKTRAVQCVSKCERCVSLDRLGFQGTWDVLNEIFHQALGFVCFFGKNSAVQDEVT